MGNNELVTYDSDADVLYVQLNAGDPATQTALDDLRIIDRASDGTVIGIEFIGASDGVDLSDLPFAATVEQLIHESGHSIPMYAD